MQHIILSVIFDIAHARWNATSSIGELRGWLIVDVRLVAK
jgi:hypothetical protein